jgi:hypothetical protein
LKGFREDCVRNIEGVETGEKASWVEVSKAPESAVELVDFDREGEGVLEVFVCLIVDSATDLGECDGEVYGVSIEVLSKFLAVAKSMTIDHVAYLPWECEEGDFCYVTNVAVVVSMFFLDNSSVRVTVARHGRLL